MKVALVLCAVGVLTQALVANAEPPSNRGRLTDLLQGPGDGPALRTALFAYRNDLIDLLTEWFGNEDIPRYVQSQGSPFPGQAYGSRNDPFSQGIGGNFGPPGDGYGPGLGPNDGQFGFGPAGLFDPSSPLGRGRRSPQHSHHRDTPHDEEDSGSYEDASSSVEGSSTDTTVTREEQVTTREREQSATATSGLARSGNIPSNLNGPINSGRGGFGYDPTAAVTIRSMQRQLESYIRWVDEILYEWYGYISYSPSSRRI